MDKEYVENWDKPSITPTQQKEGSWCLIHTEMSLSPEITLWMQESHKKATASEALNPGFVGNDLIQILPSEITVVDQTIEENTP